MLLAMLVVLIKTALPRMIKVMMVVVRIMMNIMLAGKRITMEIEIIACAELAVSATAVVVLCVAMEMITVINEVMQNAWRLEECLTEGTRFCSVSVPLCV